MVVQSDTMVISLLANPGHFTVERIPASRDKEKGLVKEIILQWQVYALRKLQQQSGFNSTKANTSGYRKVMSNKRLYWIGL